MTQIGPNGEAVHLRAVILKHFRRYLSIVSLEGRGVQASNNDEVVGHAGVLLIKAVQARSTNSETSIVALTPEVSTAACSASARSGLVAKGMGGVAISTSPPLSTSVFGRAVKDATRHTHDADVFATRGGGIRVIVLSRDFRAYGLRHTRAITPTDAARSGSEGVQGAISGPCTRLATAKD